MPAKGRKLPPRSVPRPRAGRSGEFQEPPDEQAAVRIRSRHARRSPPARSPGRARPMRRPRARRICACRSARSCCRRNPASRRCRSTTPRAPTPTTTSRSTSRRASSAPASNGSRSAAASRNTTAARSSRSTTAMSPASTSRAISPTRRSRCARSTASRSRNTNGRKLGVITKEMIYVAERENMGRKKQLDRAEWARERRRELRRLGAAVHHAGIRAQRSRARPRHHPVQHQPRRTRADGDRPQLPHQDQRQYRQLRRHLLGRGGSRQDGVGDPLGRRHGDGPLHRPQHPQHPRMDHAQFAGADRHRADLPGAGEGRRRSGQARLGVSTRTR